MRREILVTAAAILLVAGYSLAASHFAAGDPEANPAAAAARLGLYATLIAGNAMALTGFLVFHYRLMRRTGGRKTNVFTALGIYREFAGLVLALALVGIVLNRYFPGVPDISDRSLYLMLGFSTITVLLRGGAFLVEYFRPGFLEAEIYLWPWQQFVESLRKAANKDESE